MTIFFGYALRNQIAACSLSVQVPTLKVDHELDNVMITDLQ